MVFPMTDSNDPEVIVKIDISNSFNSTCHTLRIDVLSGRTSRDYVCGLKRGDVIPTSESLSHMFGYFFDMLSACAKLRYFDYEGLLHLKWVSGQILIRQDRKLVRC